jgi:broad specificity phosphatase PhoE
MGVYEGLTEKEIIERYPEQWDRQCTRRLDDAPTGGETYRQFHARIGSALERIKKDYADKKVLIVTHGFVTRVINWHFNNLSFDEMMTFNIANGEVVKYLA